MLEKLLPKCKLGRKKWSDGRGSLAYSRIKCIETSTMSSSHDTNIILWFINSGCSPKSLPFPKDGIWTGRLMTPTRSSMGTRDLRMALILRASPLPAWINCGDKSMFFSIKAFPTTFPIPVSFFRCLFVKSNTVATKQLTCISGAQRPSKSIRAE